MKKITVLCPSRGRPDRLENMIASLYATAMNGIYVDVNVLLDRDDPCVQAYQEAQMLCDIEVADRMPVPAAFQYLADRATGDILMLGSDDIEFRTRGWDMEVRKAFDKFPDGLALVCPNDGHGNGRPGDFKGNHWFVTRRWVDVVGCFCPTVFEHFCCDTVPEKIAALAGRLVHLPHVLVEHRHFKYHQAERDETYAYTRTSDALGLSMSQRDEAKMRAMQPWIEDRAAAVRAAIAQAQSAA